MGKKKISDELAGRRDAAIRLIYEAFGGVSRAGGVSWMGAELWDSYGLQPSNLNFHDRDTSWQDLIDDPEWYPAQGLGGWYVLDEIGFRYYLPAAMLRALLGRDDGYAASIPLDLNEYINQDQARKNKEIINEKQLEAVREFLLVVDDLDLAGARMTVNDSYIPTMWIWCLDQWL